MRSRMDTAIIKKRRKEFGQVRYREDTKQHKTPLRIVLKKFTPLDKIPNNVKLL